MCAWVLVCVALCCVCACVWGGELSPRTVQDNLSTREGRAIEMSVYQTDDDNGSPYHTAWDQHLARMPSDLPLAATPCKVWQVYAFLRVGTLHRSVYCFHGELLLPATRRQGNSGLFITLIHRHCGTHHHHRHRRFIRLSCIFYHYDRLNIPN